MSTQYDNDFLGKENQKPTESDNKDTLSTLLDFTYGKRSKKGKSAKLVKEAKKDLKKVKKQVKRHANILNTHTSQIEDLNKKYANLNSEVQKLKKQTYMDNLHKLVASENISERKQLLKEIMAAEDSRYEE